VSANREAGALRHGYGGLPPPLRREPPMELTTLKGRRLGATHVVNARLEASLLND
jgi:hypothetical protein